MQKTFQILIFCWPDSRKLTHLASPKYYSCQPFSNAGVSKRNSLGQKSGFEMEGKGELFFEVTRIIKSKQPRAFLLENVKNLKSVSKGEVFKRVVKELEELDYKVYDQVFDAKHWVPQTRKRVFLVGIKNEEENVNLFHFPVEPQRTIKLRDILEPDSKTENFTLSDKAVNGLSQHANRHKTAGNGFGWSVVDPLNDNDISKTLTAQYHKTGASGSYLKQIDKNPRKFTPRECARLQGFPDDFKIIASKTQAYKMFGNSVCVPLISAIAASIVDVLK